MKLMITLCSLEVVSRALTLVPLFFLTIYGMLQSLQSGRASATHGLPSSVPPGSLFTLDHALWLQSQNHQFQLDLRYWVNAGVEQCMGGVRYTFKTPNALIWSFNTALKPWIGTNCTVEFLRNGVLAFSVNLNRSSSSVVVWKTPTSGMGAQNLTLQDDGNLVLLDARGSVLWQSFGSFNTLLQIPSGMKFFRNNTLVERLPVYSDFSIPGCYGARMSQVDARILLFTRANLFVYHSLAVETSTAEVPDYIVIQQDIEFYNSQLNLLGTIAHNVLDNDPLPNGTNLIGSALIKDGNLMIDRPSPSNPNLHLWYYNSSIRSYCDYPLVCGEYGLCNETTGECSCPVGFRKASEKLACTAQDEATRKCSCRVDFQMPKFRSTCIADDPDHSLQPINVSFHLQPSAFGVGSGDECRAFCLRNASCNAALFDFNSSSCSLFPILYTVALASPNRPTHQVMYLKIASPRKDTATMPTIFIGIAAAGTAIILLLICFTAWRWQVNKRHIQKAEERLLQEISRLPPRFSYKDLQVATNHFSRRLAKGAFWSVFEGQLSTPDGIVKVAVKRLDQVGNTMDDQFKAEVAAIGSVSHVNLVSLKGFCMEKNARLLVFEFMPGGSLDNWIFDRPQHQSNDVDQVESSNSTSEMYDGGGYTGSLQKPQVRVLDWEMRCRIALDTAKGLEYLHHHSAQHIVHCDVKSANILLDKDFHAKVADFGLAKLMDSNTRSFAMTTLKGIQGYLAPEWLQEAPISAKSDVYSYGVVMLELLTGRHNLDPECGYLPMWVMKMVADSQGNAAVTAPSSATERPDCMINSSNASLQSTIMDERLLASEVPTNSFMHMLKLALACVQSDPGNRPSMASVVQILEGMMEVPYSLPEIKLSQYAYAFPEAVAPNVTDLSGAVISMYSQVEGR